VPLMRWEAVAVGIGLVGVLAGCAPTGSASSRVVVSSPASSSTPPSLAALPAHARAYFFGDSWTAGESAVPGRAFPYVTAEMLGWTPVVDGVGGTGYLAARTPGTVPYTIRAAAVPAGERADVVVLEGGLNDEGQDLRKLSTAASTTFREMEARFPHTPIVVVGPESPELPARTALRRIDVTLRSAAAAAHLQYISPLEEQWFTPENIRSMIDPSTMHPNTAGHAYFGGRLAVDLERLMGR
jgi:acyl-CoA thioesterase-1